MAILSKDQSTGIYQPTTLGQMGTWINPQTGMGYSGPKKSETDIAYGAPSQVGNTQTLQKNPIIPQKINSTPTPTPTPVPTMTQGGSNLQTPNQQQPADTTDPITKFNLAIMDMLKQAQSSGGNQDLYAQQTALQRAQIGRTSAVTPQDQQVLSPQQQDSIRNGSASAISPEIDAISAKIKANDSRLQNFESILGQMKTIGMDVAKLNPSKEVLQGYKNMLEAGGSPSSVPNEVIGAVAATVDWKKWASAQASNKLAGSVTSGSSGLTTDAIGAMVDSYFITGQVPALGMGAALKTQFWNGVASAISNGATIGNAVSNKALISSTTSALSNQQTQLAGAKTALGTLDKQLDIVAQASTKVDRSGMPILNKYLLYTKGQIAGDADTVALQNAITTASYEFGKILSGAAASISGTTISSAEDAKALLNANMNPAQITKIISLIKQESNNRITSQQQTINDMQSVLGNIKSSASTNTSNQDQTVRVKENATGRTGTIPLSEFDPKLYTKI